VKITKDTLKQLVMEELSTVLEQQSPEDLERQAELTADANKPEPAPSGPARIEKQTAIIQLLTDIKALMQQLVQKP